MPPHMFVSGALEEHGKGHLQGVFVWRERQLCRQFSLPTLLPWPTSTGSIHLRSTFAMDIWPMGTVRVDPGAALSTGPVPIEIVDSSDDNAIDRPGDEPAPVLGPSGTCGRVQPRGGRFGRSTHAIPASAHVTPCIRQIPTNSLHTSEDKVKVSRGTQHHAGNKQAAATWLRDNTPERGRLRGVLRKTSAAHP